MNFIIKAIWLCIKYDTNRNEVYFDIYTAIIALNVVLIFYSFLFYIHEFKII